MSRPGYPIWWDTTITIYNKYTDPQTDLTTWFKTVVTDCYWHLVGNKVTVGQTVIDSKSIICRIPKDDKYKDKSEWIILPNDQMGKFFTLGQGDIIVKGDCDFVINEYASGHHSTELLSKYREFKQCLEITEYADNTGIGRNNEHYLARGN